MEGTHVPAAMMQLRTIVNTGRQRSGHRRDESDGRQDRNLFPIWGTNTNFLASLGTYVSVSNRVPA